MSNKKHPQKIVELARKTFNCGITKDSKFRLKSLQAFKTFLQENEENIIKAMFQDLRKPREESRLEIFIAVNHINYLANELKKWMKPETPPKRFVETLDGVYIYHDPYGVVLVMGSWNVPLLTLVPVTGAIAAGNAVIIKPSHNSPKFAELLEKVLPEFLDSRAYPVFVGNISETNELLEQRLDYIYYTGSTTVARLVHRAANKFLTPTTLELGGKNPVYIDESADIEISATRIMWGKCFNSGQACISPDYILCTKKVEKEFIKFAKIAIQRFFGENPKCPIVNQMHFERLKNLLNGLKIAVGGNFENDGWFFEPTIAVDVASDHPIMQEEIFGPILAIVTVETVEEAVEFINSKEKALALYIFSTKSKVQNFILENTSCGGVTVNDTLMHLMVESLPFGGVGLSGMGCYKGKYSFETFSHKKSVLVKDFNKIIEKVNELRYPPYSTKKSNFSEFLLKYRKGISWNWLYYVIVFAIGICMGFLIFRLINLN